MVATDTLAWSSGGRYPRDQMAEDDALHEMAEDVHEAAHADDGANGGSGGMPSWIPKLLLLVVLVAFAAYATLLLIRSLRGLIVMLIASLFLSFALEPAVNWLARRGWRRGAATGAVLFGVLFAGAVMIALMVPLVVDQTLELVDRAPGWLGDANVYTKRWFGIEITGENIVQFIAGARADVQQLASNVASVGAFMLGLLFQVLTIGLFTYYLVADGPRFRRTILSALPPRRQLEVLNVWEVAVEKTGGYLYSRLLLAVINGVASFVVLQVLGVPFALPLALWQGFVSQFIPVVGTYIAAAIPTLVALLVDPWAALFFLIFVLVYQQIENYLLSPRITARTMQLHPAIAFGASLAGASISGLLGALMALPTAAVIQAVISSYVKRHDVLETEMTREHAPDTGSQAAEAKPPRRSWFRRGEAGETR
jgi:predicted PurR-regulated permease PerM